MRYLVDVNTFRHPARSHWQHEEDELLMWGDVIVGLRRYNWRFHCSANKQIAAEIPFVPALGKEGRKKGARFHTYQLLEYESWMVKTATDWAGRSISDLFELEVLHSRYQYNGILMGCGIELHDVLRQFTSNVPNDRLNEIRTALGPKHSQDAFHIFVCEEHGLDGLITLDLKLWRNFNASNKHLNSPTRVLLPSEACRELDIHPVGAEWFAEAKNDLLNRTSSLLFSRRASRRDKLAYRAYRSMIYLRDRFGAKTKFVIPGSW